MTRCAWMLLLLLGCSEPKPEPKPEVSLPAEMVDAILNPKEATPPPVEPSPLGMAVESYLDLAAADAEAPRVEVEFLTATWCVNCPRAKREFVPFLESKGYTVKIVDVSDCDTSTLHTKHHVPSVPAIKFKRGDDTAVMLRLRYDTKGKPYAPDFAAAFEKFPANAVNAPAVGISVPAISVADLTESIAGMDQDLFGVVHVTVPKDVSWTVTKKAASVLLTFKEGKQPSLRSLKYVRANPSLVSVEISPFWAEFHTDSWWPMLRTVRVEFDWSTPAPKGKTVAGRGRYQYQWIPPTRPQYKPVPQKPKQAEAEPTPAPPEPIKLGKSAPTVVQVAHAWRATVSVWVKDERTTYDLFGIPTIKECKGCGSGMIVSPQGHILTCNHVIEGVKSIEVEFCDGQKRPIKLIAADKELDLAILKVEGVDLPAVVFDVEQPKIGADAYVVGNPMGMGESVARGVVSGFNRELETKSLKYAGMVQVAVSINPGNSGGPVVNSKGDVIGVVTAMYDGEGLMFCMPAARARAFVERTVNP